MRMYLKESEANEIPDPDYRARQFDTKTGN